MLIPLLALLKSALLFSPSYTHTRLIDKLFISARGLRLPAHSNDTIINDALLLEGAAVA